MIYNIYEAHNGKNINWIGNYTAGSSFFRGIRIYLKKEIGMIYNNFGFETFESENVEKEIKDNIMFWNDNIIRVDSLDCIINDNNSYLQKSVSFNDLIEEFTNIKNNYDYIYSYNKKVFDNTDLNINYEELRKTILENYEKVKSADKIYINFQDGPILTIIYNYDLFIEELKEVNKIAKENGVKFVWN